jgi:hypothetical protein
VKTPAGLGARLEARFRPDLYWGAEFLADKVRLCAFGTKDGAPAALKTFEGAYEEAEAFAQEHGLAFEGLRGAVSHIPFKIEPVSSQEDAAEEDLQPHIDRIKPPGLAAEAVDAQAFSWDGDRFLILAREDAVRGFTEKLSPNLSALWSLETPVLSLLPYLDRERAIGHWACILAESEYLHLLFFRESAPMAYAKVFSGSAAARQDAAAFATEMKKALIYHFGSRFPGAALDAIQVWRDGSSGEIAAALKGLGIPQFTPDWGLLAAIPETFRVAGALALRGLREQEPLVSFSTNSPASAESLKLWRKRTGRLARTSYLTLAALAIGVTLLALSAIGLHLTVESKARSWSGELQRWSAFQKQKTSVESQLAGMKGLLGHRTDAYAGMQRLAGLLPAETWLESWELENTSGRRFSHRLEGYALIEGRVPEFLSALEKDGRLGSVKLKSTERIKGEKVEEKTKIQANRKDLIRFQIGAAE